LALGSTGRRQGTVRLLREHFTQSSLATFRVSFEDAY